VGERGEDEGCEYWSAGETVRGLWRGVCASVSLENRQGYLVVSATKLSMLLIFRLASMGSSERNIGNLNSHSDHARLA